MNDAKKAAFKLSKDAGRKSDAAQRKVRDLMKRAKAGEDVAAELEAAMKGLENSTKELCEVFEALTKLHKPEGEPTDAI